MDRRIYINRNTFCDIPPAVLNGKHFARTGAYQPAATVMNSRRTGTFPIFTVVVVNRFGSFAFAKRGNRSEIIFIFDSFRDLCKYVGFSRGNTHTRANVYTLDAIIFYTLAFLFI